MQDASTQGIVTRPEACVHVGTNPGSVGRSTVTGASAGIGTNYPATADADADADADTAAERGRPETVNAKELPPYRPQSPLFPQGSQGHHLFYVQVPASVAGAGAGAVGEKEKEKRRERRLKKTE